MSDADTTVSTETSSTDNNWRDKKGNYKPFYFAMILLMSFGGFFLLSAIFVFFWTRRNKNSSQSIKAKDISFTSVSPAPASTPRLNAQRTAQLATQTSSSRIPGVQATTQTSLPPSRQPSRPPSRQPSSQSMFPNAT